MHWILYGRAVSFGKLFGDVKADIIQDVMWLRWECVLAFFQTSYQTFTIMYGACLYYVQDEQIGNNIIFGYSMHDASSWESKIACLTKLLTTQW